MKKIFSYDVDAKKKIARGAMAAFMFAALLVVPVTYTLAPNVARAQTPDTTTTGTGDIIGDTLSAIKNMNLDTGEGTGAAGNIISKPLLNVTLSIVLAPVAILSYGILTIANYFFWIVGTLFNWSIVYLVFQFATTIGNSPGMLVAWSVLRDFANILLLFGFIFMGVVTILDLHSYPVNKTVPKFIIFAVLLNFSLLGAGAVIDGANVFTAAMYSQTMGASCVKGASSADCQQGLNVGIAGKIAEQSRIGTIFSGDGGALKSLGENITNYTADPLQYVTVFLGLALFVTTAAAVLLAGAILLISRAIALAFIMVTSPIGVAAMAVPALSKSIGEKWWKALISNAVFAPVFLILLFISLKITEGVSGVLDPSGSGGNLLNALTKGDTSLMGAVVIFTLIIGFMIAALKVASSFSIVGADTIYSQAEKFVGGTGGFLIGSSSFIPRTVIGGVSNNAAKAIRRSPLGGTLVGRGLAAVADKGATSSFDIRGIKGMPAIVGKASKTVQGGQRAVIANVEGNEKTKASLAKVQKERDTQLKEKQTVIDTQLKDVSGRQAGVETRIATARASGDEAGAVALEKGEKKALETEARGLKRKRLALVSGSLTESQRDELAEVESEHLAATREQKELTREDDNSELGALKTTLAMSQDSGAKAVTALSKLDAETSREALEAEVRAEADHNGLAWSDAYIQNQVTARQQESKAKRAALVARIEQHKKQEEETAEKIRLHGERVRENMIRIEQATKKLDEGMAKAETLGQAAFATSAAEEHIRTIEDIATIGRRTGLSALTLGTLVSDEKTKATVAALRKKEAGGVEGAFAHLVHEIHAATPAQDDHAPAPAAAKPAAATSAPAHDDHGGGHH